MTTIIVIAIVSWVAVPVVLQLWSVVHAQISPRIGVLATAQG
jgi:hypothetical protein